MDIFHQKSPVFSFLLQKPRSTSSRRQACISSWQRTAGSDGGLRPRPGCVSMSRHTAAHLTPLVLCPSGAVGGRCVYSPCLITLWKMWDLPSVQSTSEGYSLGAHVQELFSVIWDCRGKNAPPRGAESKVKRWGELTGLSSRYWAAQRLWCPRLARHLAFLGLLTDKHFLFFFTWTLEKPSHAQVYKGWHLKGIARVCPGPPHAWLSFLTLNFFLDPRGISILGFKAP